MGPTKPLSVAVAISLALCSLAHAQGTRDYDYIRNGIREAKVEVRNGTPTLVINGEPVPPFIFFYNVRPADRLQHLDPQMQLAAANGVHMYSFPFDGWSWDDPNRPPDYTASSRLLDRLIAGDPRAAILLRTGVWPGPGWAPPIPPSRDDDNQYADGSTAAVSLASDLYFQAFLASFRKMIRFYEQSPYAPRILGYHIEGQGTGEWIPFDYRDKGIDQSPANVAGFRGWLARKYRTDDALALAWATSVTIASARLPRAENGRFPMRGLAENMPVTYFYDWPREQDWIDYSEYISDLVADRIIEIARVIKEETGGRKLSAFFNGYVFELPGSMNGHMKMERLLRSPDIDIIAAPLSYWSGLERNGGGAGSAMGAVDSVALHGKLWMNEDDLRTHIAGASPLPDLGYNGTVSTSSLEETIGVLDRNLASSLLHRAGTWWMDLNAVGAFNDPALWQLARTHTLPLFDELYREPTPFVPDVALIVDEHAVFSERLDYDFTYARALLQDALRHSGAVSGSYYLRDFLDGVVPAAKVYIFANCWRLSQAEAATIRSRLARLGATAIWQLAPGYLDGTTAAVENVSRITGITLRRVDGYGGSTGAEVLAGKVWGWAWGQRRNVLSPRLVVSDVTARVIGRYWADNEISAAWKHLPGFDSVFVGDIGWNAEMLRTLLEAAGVHLWSESGDVVQSDRTWLVVHAAAAGARVIRVPEGTRVTTLDGHPVALSGGVFNVTARYKGETFWYRFLKQGVVAPQPFISGTLTRGGSALAGVTVTLAGAVSRTTVTGAAGTYTFASLPPGGSFTVSPTLTSFSFTPSSQSFANVVANQVANFAATGTYISGEVRDLNDTGVGGVTVTLSGSSSATQLTGIDGRYGFPVAEGGSYIVTPTRGAFVFNPSSQSFPTLSKDEVAPFFVAQVGEFTRYFAEGATSAFFDTRIALLNVSGRAATARVRFQKGDGTEVLQTVALGPIDQTTLDPKALGLTDAEFSTVIESDQPIIADRTMRWDTRGYGSHAETSIGRPLTQWYLAEGATLGGFDLFYLVQNPDSTDATIEVRYLLPAPQPPLVKTYTVTARSRFNIWVNTQDPLLDDAEVSAVVTSTNGVPVIVERAMYRPVGSQLFGAGHESAGVAAPGLRWFFAEGATGSFFDLFFLIANPSAQVADVSARYLKPDGSVVLRSYQIPANSRFNIWVDHEGSELADTAVSTAFEVTNGVGVVMERAMWWGGGNSSQWQEGHNSAGAQETGTKWGMADGEVDLASGLETYILIGNTSATAGTARVTLVFEDGTQVTRDFPMAANSRTNVAVGIEFPGAVGKRFGTVVDSIGATPAELVVERAMFNDAAGVRWAAGSNALGTRLR